ncbi:MAG TPA: DUF5372 family protein [Roseiflexaceae bacterium]
MGSRRCAHSASGANATCDWLVVTHPFHPLRGQRLAILIERRLPGVRLYVCEGGPLGTIGVSEDATDRAPAPSSVPLTGEVLAGLVEVVAALSRSERVMEPVRETDTGS